MADLEVDGGPEEEPTLQTVDLSSSPSPPDSTTNKPTLSFQQDDEEDEDESDSDIPPSSKTTTTNGGSGGASAMVACNIPEGTKLEKKQTRSLTDTTSSIRDWSVTHLKMTRQALSEQFGRSMRTVDPELENRISAIRDTQRKYNQLTSLMGQLRFHMESVINTQQSLAEHFGFLSVKCPELHTEFSYNSEAQKKIARNGKTLLSSINFFISNIYTVSSKAIEDTLATAKNYESVRLLHDAYRTDLEAAQKASATSQSAANRVPLIQEEYGKQKTRYDQLRKDLDIKLKLLDENRLKVMQKQLIMLNSAFAAYFSGNHSAMESLLQEFQDKLQNSSVTNEPPAWLEDLPDTPPLHTRRLNST